MRVFDIETNGLLKRVTKAHLLTTKDSTTGLKETHRFPQGVAMGARSLMEGTDVVCGHNIIGYDIPVLQKLYPWFNLPISRVMDTMVLSRLLYPNLAESDQKLVAKGKLPKKLTGSHSLEAWGYRLGNNKGEYTGGWEEWNPEMEEYCVQDTAVTTMLLNKCITEGFSEASIILEHQVQHIIQRQVRKGVYFDVNAAEQLYATLLGEKARLEISLKDTFGSWYQDDGLFTPKVNNKTAGFTKGVPLTKVSLIEFNPGSRAHIAYQLTKRYGWEPTELTETGIPKVNDEVLSALTRWETVPLLLNYLLVVKRLGQLNDGQAGWLKLLDTDDGRIHGGVNSNGAVTGRMTHSGPNLAQVPKVKSLYGRECRALFVVPKGKKLVGCDASGLELRMLAHFMGRYDGGTYALTVVEGKSEDGTDIHTVNQRAAGLPTRDDAKTFIYALLYGAGDEKIGSIIGKGAPQGRALKNKFFKALPALEALKEAVSLSASKGWVTGLDGRKLYVRSAHSALNTVLQSAGALVMKKALVLLDDRLQAEGLVPGVDYEFVLNVHDEFQIEVSEHVAPKVSALAVWSIEEAGRSFNLRCPLTGESKIGNNWAETH